MAWIRTIDEADAGAELKGFYTKIVGTRGRIANILKIHSVHPQILSLHAALYQQLMFGRSELSRSERELIAVAVSSVNQCHY